MLSAMALQEEEQLQALALECYTGHLRQAALLLQLLQAAAAAAQTGPQCGAVQHTALLAKQHP